ncbi:hypothetical protein [Phenylobacterium aquaticum]|uniref:hypothetical protein n=1 Tax=Phenylobacterium aquaticum TaxID=1763816 RepID=UPI0026F2CFAD|nr:hypothetical protein [Phenylobacterium aquaticum]
MPTDIGGWNALNRHIRDLTENLGLIMGILVIGAALRIMAKGFRPARVWGSFGASRFAPGDWLRLIAFALVGWTDDVLLNLVLWAIRVILVVSGATDHIATAALYLEPECVRRRVCP